MTSLSDVKQAETIKVELKGLLIFVNSHIRITRIIYTKTLKHFKQDLLSQSDVYKSTPLLRRRKDATILRFLRHFSIFTKFGFGPVSNSFIDTDHYR